MLAWLILALSTQGFRPEHLDRAKEFAVAAGYDAEGARFEGMARDNFAGDLPLFVGGKWRAKISPKTGRIREFTADGPNLNGDLFTTFEQMVRVRQVLDAAGFKEYWISQEGSCKFEVREAKNGLANLALGSVRLHPSTGQVTRAWFPSEPMPTFTLRDWKYIGKGEAEYRSLTSLFSLVELDPIILKKHYFGLTTPGRDEVSLMRGLFPIGLGLHYSASGIDEAEARDAGTGVLRHTFSYALENHSGHGTVSTAVSATSGDVISVQEIDGGCSCGSSEDKVRLDCITAALVPTGWKGLHRVLKPVDIKDVPLRPERIIFRFGDWIVAGSRSVNTKILALRLRKGYRYYENPGIPEELTR